MKKLLLATFLCTGFAAFVPSARAHYDDDRCDRYDRYDRPVYRESYAPSYRYYQERPQYYYRPAPVYRSYSDDYCRPTYRKQRRSSVSLFFGF